MEPTQSCWRTIKFCWRTIKNCSYITLWKTEKAIIQLSEKINRYILEKECKKKIADVFGISVDVLY